MSHDPDCAPRPAVLTVGLTGGIATGKSTVAGMLRELNVPVVDADTLVHGLLEPGGAAVEPVRAAFGPAVLRADGGIDRSLLGERVFRDEAARKRLEEIVHPLVFEVSQARLRELAEAGQHDIVVYDAPLLIEAGRHRDFDRLVVVSTSAEVQLQRLIERERVDADRAGARIRAQLPLARKLALADYVIDNGGHWQETRRSVAQLLEQLQEDVLALRAGRPLQRRRKESS